jgi:large subunit ribosomal protein L7/L12
MADEDTKQSNDSAQDGAEAAAETAETAAETATEAAEEAKEAAEEAKKAAEEVQAAPIEEPKKEEAPKAEEKKEVKPVSKDLESIIEKIEKLSVLELADLVHALEDRFGVTAAAPMAMAAGPAAGAAAGEPAEEQTTFNVILASAGANKIGAIKAVRELVPTLGLKEAKDLVEAAPKPVLEGVNKETANEAKTKLTAAGATVELQ